MKECGVSNRKCNPNDLTIKSRIINGQKVELGEYPVMMWFVRQIKGKCVQQSF
jgi:secreted trypsin-like serine protease